jgi:hypothetical protein
MKFMLIRIILASISIISAYKWGDWKNWRKYYPTMLFFGMGDLIYISVFHDNLLWKFHSSILVPSINELFVIFTIFFSSTLLFLSKFPKNLYHKFLYIALWIAIYMALEIFTLIIGMIKYDNGWNLWWSLLHNTIQFPLIFLHHKNPILAWIIAFIFLGIVMKTFNMPFLLSLKGV